MNINLKENQNALIIGDIHGCYEEMIELIDKSGIRVGKDDIIAVGDMLDRGYRAYEVIKFFKYTPNAFSIMGNHELKHLQKMIKNESLYDKEDFSGELQRLMLSEEEYSETLDFISTLPLYIDLSMPNNDKYLIVHAGWHNNIIKDNLKLEINNKGTSNKDLKYVLGIGSQGREGFYNIGDPWFNSFISDVKVVFGHTKYETVERGENNNVFGIDTGCYEGRNLSGLLLPAEEILEVRAKKNYYKELLTEKLDDVYLYNFQKLSWKDKEFLLKESKSFKLLEKIELDYKEINVLFTYIKCEADEYKRSFEDLNDELKKEIGSNWNKKDHFPKEISKEIKKAFFNEYKVENLYMYDIEKIQYFNSIFRRRI